MINKVTLVGNMGRDPELRRLESGAAMARFSLATSDKYKDQKGEWQEQTEWHEIVLWRQMAERAEHQLHKGMLIYVEGKLSTRSWQDKEGNNRKTTEVIGNYVRILNARNSGGEDDQQATKTTSNPGQGASDLADFVSEKPSPSGDKSSASNGPNDAMDNEHDNTGLPF